MAHAGTQAMPTTLPRPAQLSINPPPNAPLPALPVAKTRKSVGTRLDSESSPTSSQLPTALTPSKSLRSPSSSIIAPTQTRFPVRPSLSTQSNPSSSGIPTVGGASSPLSATSLVSPTGNAVNGVSSASAVTSPTSLPTTPAAGARQLRKTISIGSFPQPPKSVPGQRSVTSGSSIPPSPLSASYTLDDAGAPELKRTESGNSARGSRIVPPPRDSSLQKKRNSGKKRVTSNASSIVSGRPSMTSFGPASMVNGGAEGKTVSIAGLGKSLSNASAYSLDDAGSIDAGGDSRSIRSSKDSNKGNVIVGVRVRPESAADAQRAQQDWEVNGQSGVITYKGRDGGDFLYDNVFSGNDSNARVYDSTAKRLVRRVMEGYHGTVFAYGMTGTGKTFSMQGTAGSLGIIPLAIADVFSFIRETPQREFLLRVSYLEIYKERIVDLLVDPATAGPQEEIKLREDSKRGVYATPLKEEIVQSPNQLLRVIGRGDAARKTASTQWNLRSSRSHAVVQVVVESRERAPVGNSAQENRRTAVITGGVRVSTLSLIDLAGSEKAAEDKERQKEGKHINKSLLTLGTIVAKLSESKAKGGAHLPYRDSKLTRLLQPALSGNSLISILCTIQVATSGTVAAQQIHTGETLNTLKFALRAKNSIVSHAKKAEEAYGSGGDAGSRALLDRYRIEIDDLRSKLEEQTRINRDRDTKEDEAEEKARELEAENRREEQMLEMQLARTALKERIEHLNRLILSSRSVGVNSTSKTYTPSSSNIRGSNFSSITSPVLENHGHLVSARSSSASHTGAESPHPLSRLASSNNFSSSTPALVSSSPRGSVNTATTGDRQSAAHGLAIIGAQDGGSEEEADSINGADTVDGTATLQAQIRALQADLGDKNRYISTLETRLHQARRSSQSRISMTLGTSQNSARAMAAISALGGGEEAQVAVEALVRDKDTEIAELRARLDDKDRMMAALRSAARKRDFAELTTLAAAHQTTANGVLPEQSSPSPPSQELPHPPVSSSGRRGSGKRRSSGGGSTGGGSFTARSPSSGVISPMEALTEKRMESVEDVTKMVDEMIEDNSPTLKQET